MYTGLNFADYAFGAPVDDSTKDLDAKVKDMHKRSFREPGVQFNRHLEFRVGFRIA